MKMRPWSVFGAKSRPSRLQGGFQATTGYHFFTVGAGNVARSGHFSATLTSQIELLSIGWHMDPPKMLPGMGFGKTRKFNEHSTRTLPIFDRSEPRLALYSSLITHFRHFRKKSKKYAKRDATSLVFWSKNGPWAAKGRLILTFWSMFGDLENR